MGMGLFSSGLASNTTRYIQETMYMQFIPRSVLALCLLMGINTLYASPEGYEANIPAERQYQSSYIQNGNKVEVKRSLYAQRPGAVCQAEELKQFNAFFPVFLSDMRGQIFYE